MSFRGQPAPASAVVSARTLGVTNESSRHTMPEITLPATSAASLARYLLQWLRGLAQASEDRKRECLHAVEAVLAATRRTQRYLEERERGQTDPRTEAQLAVMWTELGFQLEGLGIKKLAKRCDVKGMYWSNRRKFEAEWWQQADIGLEAVARLARQLRAHIQATGAP